MVVVKVCCFVVLLCRCCIALWFGCFGCGAALLFCGVAVVLCCCFGCSFCGLLVAVRFVFFVV